VSAPESAPSRSSDPPAPPVGYSAFDPRRAANRLIYGGILGLAAALALPSSFGLGARVVAWWDAAAITALVLSWHIIVTCNAHETHCRAAATDPGRTLVWVVVIFSAIASLFAATVVLHHVRGVPRAIEFPTVLMCLTAVLVAWTITHTSYTLRYAHLYYRDDEEGVGGLEFPGGRAPDYMDFAYLAFTVGMCFQVSDVTVSGRYLRRAVLTHALLSFVYNTVILALALNLLGGLFGG
jgi:uncharacterized membrane protein